MPHVRWKFLARCSNKASRVGLGIGLALWLWLGLWIALYTGLCGTEMAW